MLIIRRQPKDKLGDKPGCAFTIGENVTVKVMSIDKRGNVVIGVEAPRDMVINRDDMHKGPKESPTA